jgi:hypothetical protein
MTITCQTFTIESLIRTVFTLTGEQFVIVGKGRTMGLQLSHEEGSRPTFAPRGHKECVRYLQGMIRAASILKKSR